MVAVLPFTTSGLADDSEFFAKGIHDDLLTQLAQLQSIRVISRTSVLEYRGIKRNSSACWPKSRNNNQGGPEPAHGASCHSCNNP